MKKAEEIYWLALTQWKGIGPTYAMKLLQEVQHPRELFVSSVPDLRSKFPDFPDKFWKEDRAEMIEWAEDQYRKAQKHDVRIITAASKEYPIRFRHFDQMPIVLFYKGTGNLNGRRMVGVIGTRNPTAEGKMMCEQFIKQVRAYDPVIVSGLAYGIDITAHRSALENGLQTIAIMGTGLQEIYPVNHRKTAVEITKNGGVLTQFPFGEGPDREHFPMRNKLIAALSDALIVVESKRKGGSMITAQLANDYNKDVFAFPGKPGDVKSAGCNLLIKSHRANLLENTDDLAYVMRWEKSDEPLNEQRKLFVALSPEEEKVLSQIRKNKETSIDQISLDVNIPVNELASILLQLEFKDLIKSLPGNLYIST